jgi:hypothetical protein
VFTTQDCTATAENAFLKLFYVPSEYLRAEVRYSTKGKIAEFYRGERKIVGVHTLSHLYESGDTVIVDQEHGLC